MRPLFLLMIFWSAFIFEATSQTSESLACPKVKLTVHLLKDALKVGEDIQLIMVLENKTNTTQQVWFDKPKLSTGGPAMTLVTLTNEKTGQSVLKYQNKTVLASQVYSTEQINKSSYQLMPRQTIKGQFSLYDLVVVKNDNYKLSRGTYVMQVFYCINSSNRITFTVI